MRTKEYVCCRIKIMWKEQHKKGLFQPFVSFHLSYQIVCIVSYAIYRNVFIEPQTINNDLPYRIVLPKYHVSQDFDFDQQFGVAHSNPWPKSAFSVFFKCFPKILMPNHVHLHIPPHPTCLVILNLLFFFIFCWVT